VVLRRRALDREWAEEEDKGGAGRTSSKSTRLWPGKSKTDWKRKNGTFAERGKKNIVSEANAALEWGTPAWTEEGGINLLGKKKLTSGSDPPWKREKGEVRKSAAQKGRSEDEELEFRGKT